jgi:protocatechuate 3,4-dioxygenase, alpha subunit
MSRGQTPSQTVGPFFKPSLIRAGSETLATAKTRGERIIVAGRVLDGDGAAVNDAMIEIWQANADGRYDHPDDQQEKLIDPNFRGFGRAATDEEGRFRFATIMPGAVAGSGGVAHAPHINVSIFARGLLKRLVTRIYFPGEPLNAADPLLAFVPAARRSTLIARAGSSAPMREFIFDINLQGANETVFLDI